MHQAGVVVNLLCAELITDEGDDRERPQVHEEIHGNIERHGPHRAIDAGGIVQSMSSGDYGGATRGDLAVGTRASTTGFAGGVKIYYLDTGIINSGTDPSAGTVVNMVPALASGNFNFGLNSTAAPTPYLTDLAAGVKMSSTTGALYVFIR